MDQVDTQDEKAIAMRAALEKRRERLRAFADTVLEVIETLPTPETFLEAGRAMRVASALDRFLVRLYSEVDLRAIGPMERAVRRVTKSGPESKPGPEPKPKSTQEELEASAKLLEDKLLRYVKCRRETLRLPQDVRIDPETYENALKAEAARYGNAYKPPAWMSESWYTGVDDPPP